MNEIATKRKRVAAYARVSTLEQSESGYSISGQLSVIEEYCNSNDLNLIGTYVDRGISGKSLNKRDQLKRLLEDVKHDKIDILIVWKNSRLSRNTRLLLEIIDMLTAHNVTFYSISEDLRIDTASGRFMLQVMAALAEFERNETAENVVLGMKKRARDGYTNGNQVLGYDNVEEADGTKALAINENEAPLIRFIFERYLQNQGLRAIANEMNHRGYRTKKGNTFSTTAVRDILHNPVYVGMVRYAQYEQWDLKRRRGKSDHPILVKGNHKAIISHSIWEQTQSRLKLQSREPKWNHLGTNVLTGLLRCPECGGPMIASNTTNTLKDGTKKRTRYYSCQAFRSKGSAVCHANSIRADVAESLVVEKLNRVLSAPDVGQKVVQQMEKRWADQQRMIGDLITNKQRDIAELVKKKQRLQSTIDEEPMVKPDLEPRIHQLTVEQVHAETDLQGLQQRSEGKADGLLAGNVDQLLQLVAEVVRGHDTKTLKHIYQLFIESVTFDRQEKLVWVHMRFDDDVIASLKEYTEGTSNAGVPFLHGRTVAFVL